MSNCATTNVAAKLKSMEMSKKRFDEVKKLTAGIPFASGIVCLGQDVLIRVT